MKNVQWVDTAKQAKFRAWRSRRPENSRGSERQPIEGREQGPKERQRERERLIRRRRRERGSESDRAIEAVVVVVGGAGQGCLFYSIFSSRRTRFSGLSVNYSIYAFLFYILRYSLDCGFLLGKAYRSRGRLTNHRPTAAETRHQTRNQTEQKIKIHRRKLATRGPETEIILLLHRFVQCGRDDESRWPISSPGRAGKEL